MLTKDDNSSARLLLADGVVEDLGSSPCLGDIILLSSS